MTFIHNDTTGKKLPRSFSAFSLIPALLIMSVLLLSTAALAANRTSTTLAVSPASTTAGSVITLAATVTSAGAPLTSGQVVFCNATASFCDDSAVLGTVWVTKSGTATLRRTLAPGTTNVKAVFQATTSYATSSSSTRALVVTGQQTTATSANTFPTLGSNAAGIVSGDFNNDGYPDLAIADDSGTIQIFLGNGDGTFTTGASIRPFVSGGTGLGVSLATADFNGDGNLDLVANGHYILLGKGDGTFTIGTPTALGSSYGAQVADFNGDGHADIVVFTGDSDFMMLLGNGDGTFTQGPVTGSSGVGIFFTVGDFNGDGIPDIAVTGGFSLGVQILLGNGDGSFTDGTTYLNGLGIDAEGIAAGDFNGDGHADLAVSDMMNQTVTILTGNGDGTFTVGTPVSTGMPAGSGAYQRQVVTGDFNGDGHTDAAVVIEWRDDGDPSLSVLFGNGDGTFGLPSTFTAVPADAFYEEGVAVGDFFGTGKDSIALLTGVSPSYVTILQDTSAGFTPVKKLPTITWSAPAAITYPTPLSATQLNATANVPGTFVYTPAAGTVLAAGWWQTLSVTFIPTDTVDYSPAEAMVSLTVNPAPPVTYTLLTSTKSVEGSASVILRLFSTNYAGTVTFTTSVKSTDGTASNVSASAPSVTLTDGGTGSSVLTITSNANAANRIPIAPWTSGGAVVFGAILLAPFTTCRKRALAVLLTAVAISLAGLSMACSGGPSIKPPRNYTVTVTPTGTGTVTNPAPLTIMVTVQ